MDDITIEIKYKGKTYHYNSGAKAYIFHSGIYNNVHKQYGIKGLTEYVNLVFDCYIKDSNRTPLGELCDFIAIHFKKCKKSGRYEILDWFYEQNF